MDFIEMTDTQRKIFIDAAQLHEAFIDAYHKGESYRGGMHWKKSKGKAYLFRSLDRFGNGKSLGHRSDETEKIYNAFHKKKRMLKSGLRAIKDKLKEQARFCKAAKIQRTPRIAAAILRVLELHKLLGRNLQVIGTNALYAYEAAAGIFLEEKLLATRDMDILWDIRARLHLCALRETDAKGLIGVLRKADRSFDLIGPRSFRAVNRDGYMVDLVKPAPREILTKEVRQMGAPGDLEAVEIRNLQWLAASPKFEHTVIGDDGYPANIVAPDPRAFALHKLWLSTQPDREPIKRKRDYNQALAVCGTVLAFLPTYKFNREELRMFPKEIVEKALLKIHNSDMPAGYAID